MKLLTYIDLRLRSFVCADTRDKSFAKTRQLRDQLQMWLDSRADARGMTDSTDAPDLLRVIDADFVMDFCRYLMVDLGRDSHRDTVYGWIDVWRRTVRGAIREGYLPNIDVFPGVLDRLQASYPRDRQSTPQRANAVSAPDLRHEFDSLLQAVAARVAFGDDERPVLVYLFSMLCHGVGVDTLLRACVDRTGHDAVVRLDSVGLTVPLTGVLRTLADLYNPPRYTGDSLFATDATVADCCNGIYSFMVRNHIALYRSRSTLSDWLAIALCDGAPPAAVTRVARAMLDGDAATAAGDIGQIARLVTDRRGYMVHHWRVLCSYSQTLKADKLEGKLRDLSRFVPAGVKVGCVRCYNPYETVVTRVNGKMVRRQRPAFGRYLFVRCSLNDCETIERYVSGTSFLRRPNRSAERAIVSDNDMVRLMSFMQDFGDQMELVELSQWARRRQVDLDLGQRVQIQDGPYAGYQGVIVESKANAALGQGTRLFVVRITGLPDLAIAGNVTAKLSALSLTPVT